MLNKGLRSSYVCEPQARNVIFENVVNNLCSVNIESWIQKDTVAREHEIGFAPDGQPIKNNATCFNLNPLIIVQDRFGSARKSSIYICLGT